MDAVVEQTRRASCPNCGFSLQVVLTLCADGKPIDWQCIGCGEVLNGNYDL